MKSDPKFIIDSMAGNIVRKLRILGYDCLYSSFYEDNVIIRIGCDDKRIIVTRDKQLYRRSMKMDIPCILLTKCDEYIDIMTILKSCKVRYIMSVPNLKTRCSICNGRITKIDKYNLDDDIPTKVYEKVSTYFRCTMCLKLYWDGVHIKNINILIRNLNYILSGNISFDPKYLMIY